MAFIFVFGSNLAGRHGKGAALWARKHRGAIYGVGEGIQGQSYAIPTKDERLKSRALAEINTSVQRFLAYAKSHPNDIFQVTPIGCGLAGFKPEQVAPMFEGAPFNVSLPDEFLPTLATVKLPQSFAPPRASTMNDRSLRQDQMLCPACGEIAESDSADVGVGLIVRGNFHCSCGWEIDGPEDFDLIDVTDLEFEP